MTGLAIERVRSLLKQSLLTRLFIEELGWDRHSGSYPISLDGVAYRFKAIAEKRGVVAFECTAADGLIPTHAVRVHLERELRKLVHEHVVVFLDSTRESQIWQWVRREPGKAVATREHRYHSSQPGDSLIAKLDSLLFTLNEEDSITIAQVTQRAKAAFDVEAVTKRFFDRFQAEHKKFLKFIKGFQEASDAEWYASLMLNRLMFVYFIQRRGFLDNDRDYLRNRMESVQELRGKGRFHSFYRYFLIRLFHEGLGQPESTRLSDLDKLLGEVPYLNGGLFETHRLEADGKIDIADEAFEVLFDFFDSYTWHLDDRPLARDNEINPDVLGYIFEKYINLKEAGEQRKKGAYYTKEDVTGYIASNCIGLALVGRLRKTSGAERVRTLMRDVPERYMHPAALAQSSINETPMESGRRLASRRLAVTALQNDSGWLTCVDHNTDFSVIVDDIVQESSLEDLAEVWDVVYGFTVLDPTCGSGAFLFAALRFLQAVYEALLGRMEAAIGDADVRDPLIAKFESILREQRKHPNPTYFVVRTILLQNLYGVDIMDEAVEICKLRLFLQAASTLRSAAELEPLPDLDFNIRGGNSVVGFADELELKDAMAGSLDLEGRADDVVAACADAAEAFVRFRAAHADVVRGQTAVPLDEKTALREALTALRATLDGYMMDGLAVAPRDRASWIEANQPFHWFAEFYSIVANGGFDVIVGNPPYADVPKQMSRAYFREMYSTALEKWSRDEDLYTLVLERSLRLLSATGAMGMVLPLSISFSTQRPYVALRERVGATSGEWWFSHYDRIPSALFGNDVRTRCTIAIYQAEEWTSSVVPTARASVTELLRWTHEERPELLQKLSYAKIDQIQKVGIPKVASDGQALILKGLLERRRPLGLDLNDTVSFASLAASAPNFPENSVFVAGTAYNWFPVWREIPETTDELGKPSLPARTACFRFRSARDADTVFALLGSSLGYWWWAVASDGFNLKKWLLTSFPLSIESLDAAARKDLAEAGAALRKELRKHYTYKENKGQKGNWYMPACGAQVRDIDDLLVSHVDVLTAEGMAEIRAFNARFSTASSGEEEDDEE